MITEKELNILIKCLDVEGINEESLNKIIVMFIKELSKDLK